MTGKELTAISGHWTDRPVNEPLGDWIARLVDNCDWEIFDAKIEELKKSGSGFPGPTVELLYYLRVMKKNDPC